LTIAEDIFANLRLGLKLKSSKPKRTICKAIIKSATANAGIASVIQSPAAKTKIKSVNTPFLLKSYSGTNAIKKAIINEIVKLINACDG